MKRRNFLNNPYAVAGVIEALLLVALVAIILSFIQLYYIPEIMKDREADLKIVKESYNSGWNDRDKSCEKEIEEAILIERKKAEKYCEQKIFNYFILFSA